MKSTQDINGQYAQLCMKLGDLLLNREKLDARVAEVKAEIEVLNKALPVAEKIERQLNLDVQAQQDSAIRASQQPGFPQPPEAPQVVDVLPEPTQIKTAKAGKKKKEEARV